MIIMTFLLSLIVLLWSANQLVSGASGLAVHYQFPPLLAGITLVAFGTSAPEIMIAISASLENLNDIAIGNAIGTNIANIGLVLGLTALFKPIKIQSTFLRREYPLLFLVMLFTYSLMLDGYLSVLDGCFLLLICLALIGYFVFLTQQQKPQKKLTLKFLQATLRKRPLKTHMISFVLGLFLLPFSARFLVSSCVALGEWLGVSELIISLTVVAIGTSLPELVTSIVAVMKGADDIAVGNILGSNLFNLAAVLIFPGLIHPAVVSHAILWRDIPVMLIMSLVLLWMNYYNKKNISRWQGGILILIYCCYLVSLIISASS